MTKRTIKSFSVKTLAIFLSVLMIFYLIPATAYASLFEATEAESVVSETTKRAGEVFEDISRREENVKHFRLEDGTYMAAQYDTAVHTLDENGEWQDIDNTLSESGSEYSTSNARIKFAKKITGNESIFTLHENNRKITLSLDGAIKKTPGVATNTETEFDETATTLQKMMTLDKLSSRIIYEDILDGVDLEYIVVSNNVKENIIAKEKKDAYSYSFTLKLNNLSASLSATGDVEITDPDSGKVQYIIPAPVVYDANMTYASEKDAYYTLDTIGQKEYRLTVTANTAWMNASDRAFPVTIDPAIYHGGYNMQQMCDTCVSQNYPTSVYGSRTYLKVGYDSANANLKAYVAMRTLPTLPVGSMITDAKLNLTFNGTSEGNFELNPLTLVAKKITRSGTSLWSETSVTYSNSTSFDLEAPVIDYYTVTDSPTSGGLAHWNITPAVVDWYANNTNQGISISQYDTDDTTVHTVQFHSSDSTTAGTSYTPFFTISYVSTIGVEGYYSYQSASAGLAGTGYVNTATGALALVNPLLSTTDSLMPYTVSMTYNSEFAGKAYQYPNAQTAYSVSYMPYGFKLNMNETVIEKKYTNSTAGQSTYYIWADSDGTEHVFLPVTGNTTLFKDEDGLQLTLSVSSSTCTIEDDGKTVKTFTKMSSTPASDVYSAWYLTSIKDKNNNKISFTFDSNYRPVGVQLTPNGSIPISFLTLAYNNDGHLAMIRNDTSKEAIIFRYSSTYGGSVVTSETKYLKEVVYAHGNSSVTLTNWNNFYNSASNDTNITEDAKAAYTYNSTGLLTQATENLSGYRIYYTYSNGKVTAIQEYGSSNPKETSPVYTPGQMITLSYGTYNTVVRTSGTNDSLDTGSNVINNDDLLTTYCFDTAGRTVNCYTTDINRTQIYGSSSGQYVGNENENAKNNLKSSVQTNYTANNYIFNGGFENGSDTIDNWSISQADSLYCYQGFNVYRTGRHALVMSVDSSHSSCYTSQTVRLAAGEYSFSMYVDNYSAENESLTVSIILSNTVIASETFTMNDYSLSGNYSILQFGFDITSNDVKDYTIKIEFNGTPSNPAIIYIDDVMLSRSLGSTEYDMVQMGHFEQTNTDGGGINSYWCVIDNIAEYDIATESNGMFGQVIMLEGGLFKPIVIEQTVYQVSDAIKNDYFTNADAPGEEEQLYTVSGWAKGTAQCYSDNSVFAIVAEVTYCSSNNNLYTEQFCFDFVNNITDWQFVSGGFSTNPSYGIVDSIKIQLIYYNHDGDCYFDGISLKQNNAGTSIMSYNSDGDIEKYRSGSTGAWYTYNNNNLESVLSSDGSYVIYQYDSCDRITSETHKKYTQKFTAPEDLSDATPTALYITSYVYNTYGQITKTTLAGYQNTTSLAYSSTTYNTASGSRIFGSVSSETDTLGKTTYFFYDDANGRLLATISPNGEGVSYEYDAIGRMINATPAYINQSSSDGYSSRSNAESVTYTYSEDTNQLSTIKTESTTYSFSTNAFGKTTLIKINTSVLASYEYNSNNGKLQKLIYGNGHTVEYFYDALDRISEIKYNIGDTSASVTVYSYTYDTAGNLFSIEDHINNEITVFTYDGNGKLMNSYVCDSATYAKVLNSTLYYDEESRLSFLLYGFDYTYSGGTADEVYGYSYTYNEVSGFLDEFNFYGNYLDFSVTPEYDSFGKTLSRTITAEKGSTQAFYNVIEYSYVSSQGYTSARVAQYASRVNRSDLGLTTTSFDYTYDDNGNIMEIRTGDTLLYKYTYDDLGQLIREDNVPLNESYVFVYDNAGNILSKTTYSYSTQAELSSVSYVYGNTSWGDLLTSFDGISITYDTIGNPTVIGGLDLTWQGRQLSSITRDDSFTIEYGYDADGIRKYKEYYDWDTGETTRHEYLLNGTQIIRETVYTGMSTLSEAYTLVYLYDETGTPIGIKYRTPSYAADVYETFFFEKNLQGDIIAIYNESGVKIGTYTYDAWGNFTVTVSSSVTTLESLIVREYNPIRYRGYYYDIETEWYYLQSRYYNPEWGRFINADGYVSTGTGILGYNMFAYCNNNPIMFVDTAGQVPITFLVLTVLVLSTALLSSCDGFVLEPGSEFDSKKAADDKARQEATEETFGDFHDALNHSYDIVYKSGVAPEIEYGATIYIHKDEELFLVHGPYDSDRSYTVAYKHPDKLDPLWIPIAMVHYHPGDAYHFTLSGGDYYSVAKKEQILVYGINVDKYTDKIIHYFKEPYLNYEYNWNEVYYD